MMPFVVSGTIHEAESVVEDPPTIERAKLIGVDGTTEQIFLIFFTSHWPMPLPSSSVVAV